MSRESKFKFVIYDDKNLIADIQTATLDEILKAEEAYLPSGFSYKALQYIGLKDKNGLTEIYEGDIIDGNGLVKGNIYEINEMDKRETDTVIQGFGSKTWCETVSRAILLGCRYSE